MLLAITCKQLTAVRHERPSDLKNALSNAYITHQVNASMLIAILKRTNDVKKLELLTGRHVTFNFLGWVEQNVRSRFGM